MRINHNIPAMRALNQMAKTNKTLDGSLEKLSTGLRINHAADDAAGLAITQKMDTQVRGLKQANRNAMDGISLIQTAEGALNEVHSMLQRIRELAVQVSNGTYDATDRKAVQDEVSQLQSEIERISGATEFNEMKLLNGDIDRRAFSTDADVADIVSMSDTVEAGTYTFDVSQVASKTKDTGGLVNLFDGSGGSTVAGTININGEQVEIAQGETSEQVFSKIRDLCSRVDVSVSIEPVPPFGNGKALTIEMNQFGPRKLEVTGDLALMQALGLDNTKFQPNTAEVYSVMKTVGVGQNVDLAGLAAGNVLINGVTVGFSAADNSDQAIFEKMRAANIQGIEMTYDGAGNIKIYSNKPLVIEPANPTAAADIALTTALQPLTAATAVTSSGTGIDLVKSIPSSNLITDGGAGNELTGSVAVYINGASAGVANFAAGLDLDDAADRVTILSTLNGINANTTFAFTDANPAKLISYNRDGYEVSIKPVSTVTAADISTATNLGYGSPDIVAEKGFGNLGRNIQIDASSIIYDNPATVNVREGFPKGTTVTTSGRDIVFQSNDNFELRLVAGTTTGTVTMNLLETGPMDLQIGANEGQFMEIRIQNLSPRAIGITDINLSTSQGAQEAIGIIDKAITTISTVRSKLGAYQNRLEHTTANLDSAAENMTASLSRILDADMASEMAQFTQQNIISQAGMSMLAQANQRPQALLQLLKG